MLANAMLQWRQQLPNGQRQARNIDLQLGLGRLRDAVQQPAGQTLLRGVVLHAKSPFGHLTDQGLRCGHAVAQPLDITLWIIACRIPVHAVSLARCHHMGLHGPALHLRGQHTAMSPHNGPRSLRRIDRAQGDQGIHRKKNPAGQTRRIIGHGAKLQLNA